MSRLSRYAPSQSLRLAALFLVVLLAALAVSLSGGGPAGATDYEPDQDVVLAVEGYSKELTNGYDHVLRWVRVLMAFGAVEDMTAAEAQGHADTFWNVRWDPVVAELTALEADSDHEPDQDVIDDVETYSEELSSGYDHVLRWMRALKALGAIQGMSAAEAQGYADQHLAERWDPVVEELRKLEAPPNRAPVIDQDTFHYLEFSLTGNAPRGVLVSKGFAGIFSDPDGDDLTYTVSIPDDRMPLVDTLLINERIQRVFFVADDQADWSAVEPALPEQVPFTVSLTATDPGGLSATVQGEWLTTWDAQAATGPDCELLAATSVSGLGIERAAVINWTVPANQEDACEVAGFFVGAINSEGFSFEELVTDPAARTHVLRDLVPDDYWFYVRIRYGEGTSEELVTAQQNMVPNACNVTLTVKAYDRHSISGSWTNVAGTPTGCVTGPDIEFWYKRSSDDYYKKYGKFPNTDAWGFIAGGLKPYVGYDFKIVAVNAAGEKNESNVASATIVSNDPSVTADANSPVDLRVYAHNGNDIYLTWDAPSSFGAGRTLSTYVVEWKTADGTASTEEVAEGGTGFQQHRITGLTSGSVYTVRVAARTTDSSNTTQDAWTAPSPAVTAWSEPTQAWFIDNTPLYLNNSGLLFFTTRSNKSGTAVCAHNVDGSRDTINCPAGTLVNASASGTSISTSVTLTPTDGSGAFTSADNQGNAGGPAAPAIHASGGNGTIVVVWGEADTLGAVGTIDAYIVEHRLNVSDPYTSNTFTDTSVRTHTITGLNPGTYQVRVRARTANSEDHDNDPSTDPETVHRLGFTSEILEVTTSPGYFRAPGIPRRISVTPGDSQSLIVEWEPPDDVGSVVHAYQVRHRVKGSTGAWTDSEMIYPRQTQRRCGIRPTAAQGGEDLAECVNPRRYEITGLTGGEEYEVAVYGFNANGKGAGSYLMNHNFIPND